MYLLNYLINLYTSLKHFNQNVIFHISHSRQIYALPISNLFQFATVLDLFLAHLVVGITDIL